MSQHAAVPDLDNCTSFFGVYDGHGGTDFNYALINFLNVCLFYHYCIQYMSLVSKPDLVEKCA